MRKQRLLWVTIKNPRLVMVLGHWLSTNSLLSASSSQIEFGMESGG